MAALKARSVSSRATLAAAVLAIAGASSVAPVFGIQDMPIQEAFTQLRAVDRSTSDAASGDEISDRERALAIKEAYDRLFSIHFEASAIGQLSVSELDVLLRATHTVAFYNAGREDYLEQASMVVRELERRQATSPRHYVAMQQILIAAGSFSAAEKLAKTHPEIDLQQLPAIVDSQRAKQYEGPTEWVASQTERKLIRRPVDLDTPAQIVVVAQPSCHFARNAAAAISADEVLAPIFERHAKWLMPRGVRLNFDATQEWNREHPAMAMTLAVDEDEWPMFDNWGSPTFYFLKDGVLLLKIEGWPEGGRRAELVRGLRMIGLISDQAESQEEE